MHQNAFPEIVHQYTVAIAVLAQRSEQPADNAVKVNLPQHPIAVL